MTNTRQAARTIDALLQRTFPIIYWGEDQSTEVQFQIASSHPPDESISACMVFAITDDGKIAISKPERGWGIPGGHREKGETAEECLRREAIEEVAIELGELELVGYWQTKKRFESEFNRNYPSPAYQLLYVANVTAIHDFYPQLEISERAFVLPQEIEKLHHDFENFKDIFEHILELKMLVR